MQYNLTISGDGVASTTVRTIFEGAVRDLRSATHKDGTPPSGHASSGPDLALIVSADDVDRPEQEPITVESEAARVAAEAAAGAESP